MAEIGFNPANATEPTEKVNSPSHYNQGELETIDIIQDKLSPEAFRGYLTGNILKYVTRYPHKNGVEDLEKAEWHIKKLIDFINEVNANAFAEHFYRK